MRVALVQVFMFRVYIGVVPRLIKFRKKHSYANSYHIYLLTQLNEICF